MNTLIYSYQGISGSRRRYMSTILAVSILLASLWMPPQIAAASGTDVNRDASPSGQIAPLAPTVVLIAQFQAERQPDDSIQLTWVTEIEVDIIGFYLYRSDPNADSNGPINSEFIWTNQFGQVIGDTYTYLDTQAGPGSVGAYYLEVIRATSEPMIYGPADVITDPIHIYLPVLYCQTQ